MEAVLNKFVDVFTLTLMGVAIALLGAGLPYLLYLILTSCPTACGN